MPLDRNRARTAALVALPGPVAAAARVAAHGFAVLYTALDVLSGIGAVLAAACVPFRTAHIFHPTGVWAMVGVAAGRAHIAAARREPVAA